ncbi:ATP-grasp domain-containing protein [Puia sp. P3]|uniref:ATP-grasp domain-containing protein n=1 Tax=Puia sp. P3 TaxID=3423952 RepID=UPI003D67052D
MSNKKIGILFGKERSFPMAFIEAVNKRNIAGVTAEPVRIDKVVQGEPSGYAVIIDRISQDVPFYRAYLKNAALCGTAVINNPFWWSADEKFFNNCLSTKIGVPVPKTVILPSRELPPETSDQSFSNLAFPLDWETIFHYVGFPAYMKPFAGGGWRNVYKLHSAEDFYQKHARDGPSWSCCYRKRSSSPNTTGATASEDAMSVSCPTNPVTPTTSATQPTSSPLPKDCNRWKR